MLDCHERWTWDDRTGIQRLVRLISLCAACHATTHLGLAQIRGKGDVALRQLRAVAGMNVPKARHHIEQAAATCRRRSRRTCKLDLSVIAATGSRPCLALSSFRLPYHHCLRPPSDLPEPIWRPLT
jgi:hypothetical protein